MADYDPSLSSMSTATTYTWHPGWAFMTSDVDHYRRLYEGSQRAHGNEKPTPVPVPVVAVARPWCGTCGREVNARGRFDCPGVCSDVRRAYDRARPRRAS